MATKKATGLGRGLSALLGDEVRLNPEAEGEDGEEGVREVAIDLLIPNPHQPRRHFSDDALEELSQSIKAQGILQPIVVRLMESDPGVYEIVAGERRWRAAQKARLHKVPVIVRALNDAQTLTIALIENIQRADLSPVEEARAYKQLADDLGHGQEALAEAVGKSRSHIANLLRLLNLPARLQTMVDEGQLSMGHARALINTEDPEKLARQIIEKGLTVRQAEQMAQERRAPGARRGGRSAKLEKDADTRALESDITAALGLKVSISHKGDTGGALSITYQTLEQLDDICQRLCKE